MKVCSQDLLVRLSVLALPFARSLLCFLVLLVYLCRLGHPAEDINKLQE